LQFPLAIVERAYIPGLEPSGDAMEMEGVLIGKSERFEHLRNGKRETYVTDTPSRVALFAGCRDLISLAIDA
jgi:hypothetical protein